MAIWVPVDKIPLELRKKVSEDLTIVQLDEGLEKSKKRGQINPGYAPNPNSQIPYFTVDSLGNLHCPYFYAKTRFGIDPKMDRFEYLSEDLENAVELLEDPDRNQVEVVEKCFDDLMKYGTTTVGLPPGFGKTYIGSYLTHCLRLKVIVVVPITPLIKQWKTTFENSIPECSIWCIDEKGSLPDYDTTPDVIIALDQRIPKIPKKWLDRMGTLIIDEAHMIPTRSRIENLLSIRPKYIIMETATMERGDGLHKGCHLIAGSHGQFRKSFKSYNFYNVDLPFIQAEEQFTARGVDYTDLCGKLSVIEEYNKVIVNIVRHNPDNKFIVLTRRVDHGDLLIKLFHAAGISADTLMGKKKKYVNSRVLIGTTKKISTGFDEATYSEDFSGPKSDSLIICHSVAKETNFDQYTGRVKRSDNPSIYWLNVKNKVIRRHLYGLKTHIKETGGTFIQQDGNQYLYDKPE